MWIRNSSVLQNIFNLQEFNFAEYKHTTRNIETYKLKMYLPKNQLFQTRLFQGAVTLEESHFTLSACLLNIIKKKIFRARMFHSNAFFYIIILTEITTT